MIRIIEQWKFPLVVTTIFFILTASAALVQPAFTAPDEIINYSAVRAYVDHGTFSITEAIPEDTGGVIKPRGTQVLDGNVIPLSYLSFPFILASIAKLFGEWSIYLFTPILGALALLAYYSLVREYLGEFKARISLILVASFPSVFFFTYKALWHNMPFTSFLILAVWSIRSAGRTRHWTQFGLAGLLTGAALSIRPNEAVWALPLMVVLFFLNNSRRINWRILFAGVCVIAAVLPTLLLNAKTFGGPFSFGYTLAIERQSAGETGTPSLASIRRLLLPARPTLEHYQTATRWYAIDIAPFHFVFFVIGAFALWLQRDRLMKRWLILSGICSAWLYYYYFGTIYSGYPTNVLEPSIGSSYLRYLLPATFFLSPFLAVGITAISDAYRRTTGRSSMATVLTIGLCLSGLFVTALNRDSGLVKYLSSDVPGIRQARQEIVSQTAPDAVIIAGRKDKTFFPVRDRVMGYNDVGQAQLDILPKLLGNYEIYYNDASGREAPDWSAQAGKSGYHLEQVGLIGPDPLYRFVKDE